MGLSRRGYLVLALLLVAALTSAGLYWRHRAAAAATTAAGCPAPAPPPKPVTPPPKLPGFQTAEACGPGEATPAAAPRK